MKKLESELEKQCCKFARSKGVVAVKLENCGHKGIPDRQFIKKGGDCLFVEFKNPNGTGKVSNEQDFWRNFLNPKCFVCEDLETFIRLFCDWTKSGK